MSIHNYNNSISASDFNWKIHSLKQEVTSSLSECRSDINWKIHCLEEKVDSLKGEINDLESKVSRNNELLNAIISINTERGEATHFRSLMNALEENDWEQVQSLLENHSINLNASLPEDEDNHTPLFHVLDKFRDGLHDLCSVQTFVALDSDGDKIYMDYRKEDLGQEIDYEQIENLIQETIQRIDFLIQHGAGVNYPLNKWNQSLVMYLLRMISNYRKEIPTFINYIKTLNVDPNLIEENNFNYPGCESNQWPPLFEALACQDSSNVQFLFDLGLDLRSIPTLAQYYMHSSHRGNEDILKLMLDNGMDTNTSWREMKWGYKTKKDASVLTQILETAYIKKLNLLLITILKHSEFDPYNIECNYISFLLYRFYLIKYQMEQDTLRHHYPEDLSIDELEEIAISATQKLLDASLFSEALLTTGECEEWDSNMGEYKTIEASYLTLELAKKLGFPKVTEMIESYTA